MSALFNGVCYHQYPATAFPTAQAAKTVCFWANLGSISTLQTFFNAVDTTLGIGYQFGLSASGLITVWGYGGTAYVTATAPAIGNWAHFAYLFDGTTHSIALNGAVVATSTNAAQTGQPTLCQLGGNQWNENLVSTYMEDVRLYNRVLSLNELNTVMACNTRDMIANGLVAWWPLSEYVAGSVLNTAAPIKETYGLSATIVGSAYPVAQDSVKLQRRSA